MIELAASGAPAGVLPSSSHRTFCGTGGLGDLRHCWVGIAHLSVASSLQIPVDECLVLGAESRRPLLCRHLCGCGVRADARHHRPQAGAVSGPQSLNACPLATCQQWVIRRAGQQHLVILTGSL